MKKSRIIIPAALVAAVALTPALTACSGDHYSSVSFDAQDTSYAVTSQGGSAVQYGNYIYFINGTRGYEDTDGKNNVWGEVVKGGLYRVELNGEKVSATDDVPYSTFNVSLDKASGLEFKYTEGTDYYGKAENVVNVTAIAPKTIGTTGYADGGIFIYDNYVFFGSPNNEKNKVGTVQTTLTDFFMMPLNGGKPTKIYTTTTDTSSSAYSFYKYNGKVYLVVNESGTIISVPIDINKGKVSDPVKYEVNATSVYFPVRDTYYNGIDNNTVEDFIYFVRAVTDDDVQHSGTVIEAMRPDGSENFTISSNGQTETIEAVRDGVLFFRTTISGKTKLAYNSLHDALMEHSPTYKAAQDKLDGDEKNTQFDGNFPLEISSSITSSYAFRPDEQSNEVYYVAATSSSLTLCKTDGNNELIYSGETGTLLFDEDNYLYYSGSDSDFYRVPLFANMNGYGNKQTLATETTSAGISCDYVNGYFTYFGEVDEWAEAYTYFYKVDGLENADEEYVGTFVGEKSEDDKPTEEELEKILNGEDDEDESDDE